MNDATTTNLNTIKSDREPIFGKIIKVDTRGYGFITSVEIPFKRIFFHWTGLNKNAPEFLELKVGSRVKFTPIEVEGKGWRAINIEVL